MLLLVTGASGIGKTTVRRILEPQLAPEVECAELWDISPNPSVQNLEWRQRSTELAVQRAVLLQREGRHLLLCGDPIAAVEVIAAPSTRQLERLGFCLLDADERTQAQRLEGRGDPAALLVHHHAFAEWMCRQATDPTHMLDVVSSAGWSEMTWSRVPVVAHRWVMHIIDTTASDRVQVAAAVKSWISAALSGSVPTIDPRVDWLSQPHFSAVPDDFPRQRPSTPSHSRAGAPAEACVSRSEARRRDVGWAPAPPNRSRRRSAP